jgi:hypothetical protein
MNTIRNAFINNIFYLRTFSWVGLIVLAIIGAISLVKMAFSNDKDPKDSKDAKMSEIGKDKALESTKTNIETGQSPQELLRVEKYNRALSIIMLRDPETPEGHRKALEWELKTQEQKIQTLQNDPSISKEFIKSFDEEMEYMINNSSTITCLSRR